MPTQKLNLLVCTFPYAGNSSGSSMVWEVTDWLMRLQHRLRNEPHLKDRIGEVFVQSFNDTPITMTRNFAVETARKVGADLILMVDSDMHPDCHLGDPDQPCATPFFDAAFDAIYNHWHLGPLVIGAPYGGAPPNENMFVFTWAACGNLGEEGSFELRQYTREEAFVLEGIHEAAALPTGLILYDVRCFDLIDAPYFDYEWTDKFQTQKASTEDVFNTRNINLAGMARLGYNPVRCAWSSWAGHKKVWTVGKPHKFTTANVAKTLLSAMGRGTRKEFDFSTANAGIRFRQPAGPSSAPEVPDGPAGCPAQRSFHEEAFCHNGH